MCLTSLRESVYPFIVLLVILHRIPSCPPNIGERRERKAASTEDGKPVADKPIAIRCVGLLDFKTSACCLSSVVGPLH